MAVEMRPAQALRLWHDVTLELVRDAQPDLSARQLAILLTVWAMLIAGGFVAYFTTR